MPSRPTTPARLFARNLFTAFALVGLAAAALHGYQTIDVELAMLHVAEPVSMAPNSETLALGELGVSSTADGVLDRAQAWAYAWTAVLVAGGLLVAALLFTAASAQGGAASSPRRAAG